MHRESKNEGGLGARIAGGIVYVNDGIIQALIVKTDSYKSCLVQTRVTQWIPQEVHALNGPQECIRTGD